MIDAPDGCPDEPCCDTTQHNELYSAHVEIALRDSEAAAIAYRQRVRAKAFEEAAELCSAMEKASCERADESENSGYQNRYNFVKRNAARMLARAIRARQQQEKP
jgi:hypothetical protein